MTVFIRSVPIPITMKMKAALIELLVAVNIVSAAWKNWPYR